MTLAEEYQQSTANRDEARKGFAFWMSASGPVLIEATEPTRDNKQRLIFPDESVLVLSEDGSERALMLHG